MSSFDTAWAQVLKAEGGYSNHANDRGGATKFGVTEAVARAHAFTGRMEDLTEYLAKDIAKRQYWDTLRGDEIAGLSPLIAEELFDTGYNCGIATAGKFLQQALNALNREAKDYPDVTVDGNIGPVTVHALRLYLVKRGGVTGERVLLKALNGLQCAYYITISEKRPANESFVFGWIANRVHL